MMDLTNTNAVAANEDTSDRRSNEEKEIALLCEKGDEDALTSLVIGHLWLVSSIANKFSTFNIPILELIETGNTGLLNAARRFKPGIGRFSTFAYSYVEGEMLALIQESTHVIRISRTMTKRRKDIKECQRAGINSELEIAKHLGIAPKKVSEALQSPCTYISVDEIDEKNCAYDGEKVFHSDILVSEQKEIIQQLLALIPKEKDREIIKLRFGLDGQAPMKRVQIASIFKVSEEAIRQREKNTLSRLSYHLERQNIHLDILM
tara:strand:+ start:230 stop:1018 length:789 start_codon:yes stop_codon:yes gene_type:complete